VPNLELLRRVVGEHGMKPPPDENLVDLPAMRQLIKADVDSANAQLADYEKVKRYVVLARPFSIDGGELTPSLKVKRSFVKQKYAEQIKTMQRPSGEPEPR
jgi:long-chain acyl-CoA synthetase